MIQGYGLTETAPIVTLNHPFGTKKGSVGKAIAGVEMKVAEDGEILVRGENVTQGYFNADAETAKAFEDGWFHTGDIGEIGADGQLYIRGRKKEMIVTPEGLNVFPEDVERVLNHIPGVRDSAVVGADARHRRARARGAGARSRCGCRRRRATGQRARWTTIRRSGARWCGPRRNCRARKVRASSNARRFGNGHAAAASRHRRRPRAAIRWRR